MFRESWQEKKVVNNCEQLYRHNLCHAPGQILSNLLQIVCSNISALVMIPASQPTSQARDSSIKFKRSFTSPAQIT